MFGPSFLVMLAGRVVMNLVGVKPEDQESCLAVLAGMSIPIDPIGGTINMVRHVAKMNSPDDGVANGGDLACDSASDAGDSGGGFLDMLHDFFS